MTWSTKQQRLMKPRARLWLDISATVLAAVAALVTVIRPAWIEASTGVDPDGGSGAVEVGVTVGLVLLSLASAGWARLEWRRWATSDLAGR
ncbi:MAG: ABC transporter permease [Actinomycetota bacterium]|nr:ABC transporter permease [Actinomycetota bacterium]